MRLLKTVIFVVLVVLVVVWVARDADPQEPEASPPMPPPAAHKATPALDAVGFARLERIEARQEARAEARAEAEARRLAAEKAARAAERQAAEAASVDTTPDPVTATGLDWAALRECESGGNYAINTGNGYSGAYQFSDSTWASVGGTGSAYQASPEEQDMRAQMLYDISGASPWPVCGKLL